MVIIHVSKERNEHVSWGGSFIFTGPNTLEVFIEKAKTVGII